MKIKIAILLTISVLSACDLHSPEELLMPTVDEDSSLPFLEVNGTKLHLETFGDPSDDIILFLHGGPGECYSEFLASTNLSTNYFLVMFDQRGSGLSRRHSAEELSFDILAEDLYEIINHFATNGQRVILAGHSWGCQYAALFCQRHPHTADALILNDPGPLNVSMLREYGSYGKIRPDVFSDFLWNMSTMAPDNHAALDLKALELEDMMDFLDLYHMDETNSAPKWRLGGMIQFCIFSSDFDFSPGLEEFTNSVLFIKNELSDYHSEAYMQDWQNAFPNADTSYFEMPDVGHDGMWIDPEGYMNAAGNFISAL